MRREEIKKQWELEFGAKYEDCQRANVYTAVDILDFAESVVNKLLISSVSNWVAIESDEQPEIMTDVMVKYKDGRKEVAFFDGDKRFYIEKDDRDVTETIIEWHKLP